MPTTKLTCAACRRTFPADRPRWKCDCGGLLDLLFAPAFHPEMVRDRKPTMWRYREAIPIARDDDVVSFDEGFTPLVSIDLGGRSVLVKQDHLFPTGSYKDRGASVLISQARSMRVRSVVEDSSGNAGCAVAAYCARAEIACSIYVPADTSSAKLAQIRAYGAKPHKVPGSREDTARAVLAAAEKTYYASHSWNPFFFHGTKTFAYEVVEQLGWKAPDTVILPVGNGTLLLGAAIGFEEMLKAGIISRRPKLVAVQARNCAPLYHAWRGAKAPAQKSTVGEGIAIATPVRATQIIEAVRASDGCFITVTENEIVRSLRDMCGRGFYIEPTSAATTAGAAKYVSGLRRRETIVSVFTGHGLKKHL